MTIKRTLQGYRIGAHHHRSRLTEDDVRIIWELRATGMSYRAIAEKLDDHEPPVSWRTIVDVLQRRTWTHIVAPDDTSDGDDDEAGDLLAVYNLSDPD